MEGNDMPKAIVLREHGGPEVLRSETIAVGDPGPGEARLRQTAIGVNFHDCYVRSGLYRTLKLPGIPGIEAAGTVEAVGPGVTNVAPGDRVAYIAADYGAYADTRLFAASRLVRLPDAIADRTAAALLIKGLTAELLVRRVHAVREGDFVLVQAAAGGVGQLLCQWASHLGATVIGTVGSAAKAELAARRGCRHVIQYRQEDVVDRVQAITGGAGVAVAYDSVGKDTFYGSLECLAMLGHLVNFGQSSGPVEPLPMTTLSTRSLTVTRPMLYHYIRDTASLQQMADSLFRALTDGTLHVDPPREFPLDAVADAHRALEARETVGAVVLTV
jgi:NADPH2:quinone reductase